MQMGEHCPLNPPLAAMPPRLGMLVLKEDRTMRGMYGVGLALVVSSSLCIPFESSALSLRFPRGNMGQGWVGG